MDDILERVSQWLNREDEHSAAALFDRDFLNRLALLSTHEYQQFKDRFAVECFLAGVEVGLGDARLDRMVQATRDQLQAEIATRPVAIGSCLSGVPDPNLLISGQWQVNETGLFQVMQDDVPGIQITDAPLYVCRRVKDAERNKETLTLQIQIDDVWQQVHIPASANTSQIYNAVAGVGVLVSDKEALNAFIFQFRQLNKKLIPVEMLSHAFQSLFERWSNYVSENNVKFMDQTWGRLVTIESQECLAVYPERLEAFLKKQGARLRPTLNAWRKNDYLITPKTGFLHPIWINARTCRMAIFSLELLAIQDIVPIARKDGA